MAGSRFHRVKIHLTDGEELEIEVDESLSLLENLLRNGVLIDNLCGGRGLCGKCVVKIISGKTSPMTDQEKRWRKILGSDIRLSCQVRILSDAEIELKGVSRAIEGKILTWGLQEITELKPLTRSKKIRLRKPTLQDQKGDLERLLEAAGTRHYDPLIISELSRSMRKSDFEVYVIQRGEEILDVISAEGNAGRLFGVAVDIGTTTIVGYLYDLETGKNLAIESAYNGQIKFGEDVISRVDYARKSAENLRSLQGAVVNTINEIIEKLSEKAGIEEHGIYDVVCAGNTTMLSLLLGNDCYYGSHAPYPPPFTSSVEVKARDLGIKINQRGYVKTVPSISAYVGGDIIADILASKLHKYPGKAALIDLGTNGEIVIKADDLLLSTSCAAGPALEGYGVKDGMRAVKGAIETVVIDEFGKSYYKVIGGGRPRGICGSGIIEAIAWMRIRGIIDGSGKLIEESSEKVVRGPEGLRFVIASAKESATGRDIAITQQDIRKIQLAKAAIYAALLTLSRISRIRLEELEKIFVAGAFGNYLDIFASQVLGMLPDIPREKFSFIGNGSVAGASLILLSRDAAEEAQRISKEVRSIELNTIKDFQEEFIKATHIPHMDKELFKNTLKAIESLR